MRAAVYAAPAAKSMPAAQRLNLLMVAAKHNRRACVRLLVTKFGARVNQQAEESRFTALLLAAYDGFTETVQLLLELGADAALTNK